MMSEKVCLLCYINIIYSRIQDIVNENDIVNADRQKNVIICVKNDCNLCRKNNKSNLSFCNFTCSL